MAQTKISDLLNPEIISAFVAAKLPYAIKFSPLVVTDTTLSGVAGSTITIPQWNACNEAEVVAEGVAIVPDKLSMTQKSITIHKVAKAFEITDEAILSGAGDPVAQESMQMVDSIARRIDSEVLATLLTEAPALGTSADLERDAILETLNGLDETFIEFEQVGGILFVDTRTLANIRAAVGNDFTRASALGDDIVVTGTVGEVFGYQVVPSAKLGYTTGAGTDADPYVYHPEAVFVKNGLDPQTGLAPLTLFLKRDTEVETDRDVLAKLTITSADKHFAVALTDRSRVAYYGDGANPLKAPAYVNAKIVGFTNAPDMTPVV